MATNLDVLFLEFRTNSFLVKYESNPAYDWKTKVLHTQIKLLYEALRNKKFSEYDTRSFSVAFIDLVQEVFDFLKYGVIADELPADILLISFSSLVLLLPYITASPAVSFALLVRSELRPCCKQMLNIAQNLTELHDGIWWINSNGNIAEYNMNSVDSERNDCKGSDVNMFNNVQSNIPVFREGLFDFSKFEPSIDSLLLIQGLLNVKPSWIFPVLHNQPYKMKNSDKNREPQMQLNNILFAVWPLIHKSCLKPSLHSSLKLQVLHLWLKVVKPYITKYFSCSCEEITDSLCESCKIIKEIKIPAKENYHIEDICDIEYGTNNADSDFSKCNSSEKTEHKEDEKLGIDEAKVPCILCYNSSLSDLFSVDLQRKGTVFTVLNLSWENPAKGSSSLVHRCMTELLELHDQIKPGHATRSVREILASVVESGMWHTRGLYLQLLFALSYVDTTEIVKQYPEIPQHMSRCLRSNQLSAVATDVYLRMISQMTYQDWFTYFAQEHKNNVICFDKVQRHSYLMLWLPGTIAQYPTSLMNLLELCQCNLAGWQAKLAILRIAKANNLISFDIHNFPVEISFHDNHLCIGEVIRDALIHEDDNIRADALGFLCLSKKTTEPLHEIEIKLIKEFFMKNINIDLASFRQSVIKCYVTLMQRLRDICVSELKKKSVEERPLKYYCSELGKHRENQQKDEYANDEKRNNDEYNNTVYQPVYTLVERSNKNNKFASTLINTSSYALNEAVDLIVWFIYFFNDNLNLLGNYARLSATLRLYWELVSSFYNSETGDIVQRFKPVMRYIELVTEPSEYSISSLSVRKTLRNLLALCTHEMNDIRNSAANLLEFFTKVSIMLPINSYSDWFSQALQMCDSPKSSRAEGGAFLLKVLVGVKCQELRMTQRFRDLEAANASIDSVTSDLQVQLTNSDKSIIADICKNDCTSELTRVLDLLIHKIEKQFEEAQKNILLSSYESPLHGSLMAFTLCITSAKAEDILGEDYINGRITYLVHLYQRLIEFVLGCFAKSSSAGSKISPSFAEMGDAIEQIIRESKEKQRSGSLILEAVDSCHNSDPGAISVDHQVVLSFGWQILKVCCWSCSKFIEKWLNHISNETVDLMITGIIIRVLTGTRHKGAMEAAHLALHEICVVIYQISSNCEKQMLIEKELCLVLDSLEMETETSITRRAAGLSMIFASACGAIPRKSSDITTRIIQRLLAMSQMKVNDVGNTDTAPVLCLHILHSMVQTSSLGFVTFPLMSEIVITCFKSFTSDSWALRNAALQLYGAVIPKLIGQKKVKDDTASVNSITAGEFCCRYPTLISVVTDQLQQYANLLQYSLGTQRRQSATESAVASPAEKTEYFASGPSIHDDDDDATVDTVEITENVNTKLINQFTVKKVTDAVLQESVGVTPALGSDCKKSGGSMSTPYNFIQSVNCCRKVASADSVLVPLLSLMVRLNPGTETQQNDQIRNIIASLREKIYYFLGYPVDIVRRLAASALYALTPNSDICDLVKLLIHEVNKSIWTDSNLVNGCLRTLKIICDTNIISNLSNSVCDLRRIVEVILSNSYAQYLNKCLAIDIARHLNHEVRKSNLLLKSHRPIPGYPVLVRRVTSMNLETGYIRTYSSIASLMRSDDQDIWEALLGDMEVNFNEYSDTLLLDLQKECWLYMPTIINRLKFMYLFRLIKLLLSNIAFDALTAVTCIPKLRRILSQSCGGTMLQNCIIIASYFVKNVELIENVCKVNVKEFLLSWLETVEKVIVCASDSSEDYRKAVAEALNITMQNVFSCSNLKDIHVRMLKVALELMQDEDRVVRGRACNIVENLRLDFWTEVGNTPSDRLVHITADRLGKSEKCDCVRKGMRNNMIGQYSIQSNVAVKIFLAYLVTEAFAQEDIELFKWLWSYFHLGSTKEKPGTQKLFESYADNVYKENYIVSRWIKASIELQFSRCELKLTNNFKSKLKNFLEPNVMRMKEDLERLENSLKISEASFLTDRNITERYTLLQIGCRTGGCIRKLWMEN